jgi:7-keto-8-aminopelargonate synthetase-like enzyme
MTVANLEHYLQGPIGTHVQINNQEVLYFAGVGYYQLQSHPQMIEAGINALKKYGLSSATSRSINGTTDLLLKLEHNIADFFQVESAAYLPSGYFSNMAGIQALQRMKAFSHLFIDENAHYCLKEAAVLTQAPLLNFKHRDVNDLNRLLECHLKKGDKPLILTDGMFPVMGNIAPLGEYIQLADGFEGKVWIDDAHGVGILGENGRGTAEKYHLGSDCLYMGATLSKAFGAYGGFITGSVDFIREVKKSSVIAGTTSPVSAAIGAAIEGIHQVKSNAAWRIQLWANARYLKSQLKNIGIDIEINNIPIAAFKIKNGRYMQCVQQQMMAKGVYIQYLNYVGAGNDGVLRIVVFSTHTKSQIDYLIQVLKSVL